MHGWPPCRFRATIEAGWIDGLPENGAGRAPRGRLASGVRALGWVCVGGAGAGAVPSPPVRRLLASPSDCRPASRLPPSRCRPAPFRLPASAFRPPPASVRSPYAERPGSAGLIRVPVRVFIRSPRALKSGFFHPVSAPAGPECFCAALSSRSFLRAAGLLSRTPVFLTRQNRS